MTAAFLQPPPPRKCCEESRHRTGESPGRRSASRHSKCFWSSQNLSDLEGVEGGRGTSLQGCCNCWDEPDHLQLLQCIPILETKLKMIPVAVRTRLEQLPPTVQRSLLEQTSTAFPL